jgi:DHA2 family multidrug resistance protein
MLDRGSKQNFTAITTHVDIYNPLVAEQAATLARGPGARLADPENAALAVLKSRIDAQALLRAFNENFMLLAFAFLGASFLILLMKRPPAGGVPDTNGAH